MKCANIEIIPTGNDLWLTGPDWTGLVVTGTGWLELEMPSLLDIPSQSVRAPPRSELSQISVQLRSVQIRQPWRHLGSAHTTLDHRPPQECKVRPVVAEITVLQFWEFEELNITVE